LRPTQLTNAAEPQIPDWIMSGYSPSAHFSDDMFANKLAFITIMNFPHYSLEEKNRLGRCGRSRVFGSGGDTAAGRAARFG
jgi:hypothetical protein